MSLLYKIKYFLINLWNYRKILWNDRQYDFGYLLELERIKLKLIIREFRRNSHFDHTNDIRWMSICVNLIGIILEEDSTLEYIPSTKTRNYNYKVIKYVNTKNALRFNFDDNVDIQNKFAQELLRQRKANYLYNKIRYTYIYNWWD